MLQVSKIVLLSCLIAMGNVHAQLGYGGENKIPLKKPDPPKSAPPPAMILRPDAPPPPAPAGSAPPGSIKKPFRVCSEIQDPANDNCVRLGPTATGTIRGHTDDTNE